MFVLRVVGLVVGLLSYASPVTTFAETDRCQPPPSSNDPREYRDRGDRCEGTSPKPVSVQDGIDLLSALIDYQDEPERIGDHFRVQFFLPPKSTKVSLVVKERDNHFFYRLDKVSRPPWTNGSYNVFAWRTADVIRRIDALRMRDLGVVVRFVDNAGDESVDQVAPAVFYQSRPLANSRIRGYVFSFRVPGYAALTGTWEIHRMPERLIAKGKWRAEAQRPFNVRWEVQPEDQEGFYRLHLNGETASREKVRGKIDFYHKPSVE